MPRHKYDQDWPDTADDLQIEMEMIRNGGRYEGVDGKMYGEGLVHHYEQMRRLIWPWVEEEDNRWYKLCRDEIVKNKVTVLMGPASSGKTFSAAIWYLCTYFCFPETTCILCSSTDLRGLDLRVWGEIKKLWSEAVQKFDYLPGYLLEAKRCITTDNIDEKKFERSKVRDLRKGIMGIPTIQNGKFIGLGKWIGVKQVHMRLIADEAQFMGSGFLDAFDNLSTNPDFRAVICGNPNDVLDQLGKAAQPVVGWTTKMNPGKTDTWNTQFYGGRCVNLIGTDSPNFDFPADKPKRFRFYIGRENIEASKKTNGEDSIKYWSQSIGAMKISTLSRRVITQELCQQFHAHDDVIWMGGPLTKIGALDAAYGGDRCVGGHIVFGQSVTGKMMLLIHPPHNVPIVTRPGVDVEQVIAEWVRNYCIENQVPPENFFHDATGRGSLGTALSRVWSDQCNPVEFGGNPTERIVSLDHFVIDKKNGQRRPELCSEHYCKFVSELWFSVRYAIEADQVRGLPEDVMEEGCMRDFDYWMNKIRLETKEEMKLRVGRSPDLFDWLSIGVEGARRRGFQISKLANAEEASTSLDWFFEMADKSREAKKKLELNFRA